MFLQTRFINGKAYRYVEHSFRLGKKVKKASFILDKEKEDYNERIIAEIAQARAEYFLGQFKTYFTLAEFIEIEKEKVFYQTFYPMLNEKSKQEIQAEFMRLFLANSMELEGSTITPDIAEDIDKNKKTVLPESDVRLYGNSKKALFRARHEGLRSIIQLKRLHQDIYGGIYPHAGKFKEHTNTFGYLEKATTAAPGEIRSRLKEILIEYGQKKEYPFLKPLLFHLQYQKVHPFTDGNSRLGRILLVAQMEKLNYPPYIFKGDLSFQIRETIVEYCNNGHLDFCRLAMEQYLVTAKKFWRPMIKKFLFISK